MSRFEVNYGIVFISMDTKHHGILLKIRKLFRYGVVCWMDKGARVPVRQQWKMTISFHMELTYSINSCLSLRLNCGASVWPVIATHWREKTRTADRKLFTMRQYITVLRNFRLHLKCKCVLLLSSCCSSEEGFRLLFKSFQASTWTKTSLSIPFF